MIKIDKKIKRLVKNVALREWRSLFIILGPSGVQKVSTLFQLQSKINSEIHVLWCSKPKVIDSESKVAELNLNRSDFAMKPYFCSYDDLSGVCHSSFNIAVLEEFELASLLALNLILSTVKGGGTVILLFPTLNSLEDLKVFNLNKKCPVSRFSQRFFQSLNSCPTCMVLDENLTVLSSYAKLVEKPDLSSVSTNNQDLLMLQSMKHGIKDDDVPNTLLKLCLTSDQRKLLTKYLDVLKKQTFHAITSASSAYGRGKSAALGLAIAGAIAMNYSNIFITSSSHSNVHVLFQFLLKGLDALYYKEDKDYDLIESANPKFKRALIGLNVFRDHPQSVRFIFPGDVGHKLEQAELVAIDEAASIPIDTLRKLIGPYVVLMTSSVCGAISTSPYLYDALIDNLQQTSNVLKMIDASAPLSGNSLQKIVISEPIHYAEDDAIETWNYQLFCMKSATSSELTFGCPETRQCQLFCVSRDVLFNGSDMSEKFLQTLISIFNQSNYLIQPEQFVKFADSPEYQIFVLMPPLASSSKKAAPEVLCAILVHVEKVMPSDIVLSGSNLRDSMPKCFNNWMVKSKLSSSRGIHILNVATHPSYKRMGYGLRAFQLLQEMYEGKWISLDEKMESTCNVDEQEAMEQDSKKSPLLLQMSEVKLKSTEFLCVSFSLTENVFSFWRKAGFIPIFLGVDKSSDSNICFMVKSIAEVFKCHLLKNWHNFKNYYFTLLNSLYQNMPPLFALSFLQNHDISVNTAELTKTELDLHLKPYDMKTLEKYCTRLQDLNSIIHIVPILAKLYFTQRFQDISIPTTQEAILLSYGLQNKSIDQIAKDLKLQGVQIIGLLNRTIKKLTGYLTNIIEKTVEKSMATSNVSMKPLEQDLDEELEEAAEQIKKEQKEKLLDVDVAQYAIKGSEDDWQKALSSGRKTLVSIKNIKRNTETENPRQSEMKKKFKKPLKKRKK